MRIEQIEEIGKGGLGRVYKGFSRDLHRWVTLKALHPVLSADPLYQTQLKKEAELLVRLSHPNIVSFIDYGSVALDQRSEICLILEYIEGVNLQERLNSKGPLTFEEIVPLFLDLCLAIDYLHQNQVLHFDLKPENILFNDSGRLILTDFGISSIQFSREKTSPLLDPMGSLSYSPPEKVKGEHCDGRSDLYSLGMILYTLLHGRSFFEGREKNVIWGELVYETNPYHLLFSKEVPLYFQEMIRKLVSRHPNDRYPDVKTLLKEFHQNRSNAITPASLEARSPELISHSARNAMTEKVIILVSGVIVVLFSFFFWERPELTNAPSRTVSSGEAIPSAPRSSAIIPEQTPEPVEPVIQIASLTREEAAEERSIPPVLHEHVSQTLSDDELEKFLLHFKSNLESKNLPALEKEMPLSSESRSYFNEIFMESPKPWVNIHQIKREGASITVHYGITIDSSSPVRKGLLLFNDGAWHLTPNI